MTAVLPSAPVLDRQAMARHISVLFEGIDGFAVVRLISEKGAPPHPPKTPFIEIGSDLTGQIAGHADQAARAGMGLFIVPGAVTAPGKATAKDVSATAIVIVDIDEGDIEAKVGHLVQHIGQPTLDVFSGGRTEKGVQKRHLYWRLTEVARGEGIAAVCRLRSVIATKVGGDPAFASAHQPVRLAGSIHGKHGILSPVTIREASQSRFALPDLARLVADLPLFPGLNPRLAVPVGQGGSLFSRDLLQKHVREGGVDGITRFDALSRVIGHFVREARFGRISLNEAWVKTREYNAENLLPPWPEEQLQREFQALRKRDLLQHSVADGQRTAEPHSANNEDALANRFSELAASEWRYVSVWGTWLKWNGSRWQTDTIGEVNEQIRLICRSAAENAPPSDMRRVRSDRTIRAVERIARSDPRHAAVPEQFDCDPFLLNTPAGIIDLQTGEIGTHRAEVGMTRQTAASPGGQCPKWMRFLEEITAGDGELLGYLARVGGYCLSGATTEQVFFFLHGTGANGKSVFLSVLSHVLGDYAVTAPLDTFMAGTGERHPTDLAGLRGARLVTVNETETGRAWAESRIKAITGGDRLRVRFMHCDFFEFQPTFKLLVAGNHRPRLSGVGEAMRRRLHLIPFEVTIPPQRRDKQLLNSLEAERDGILAWMLEGCAEWRRIGLSPPGRVVEAAREYFEDEDLVGQWISEECLLGPSRSSSSVALFRGWSTWAERHGINPGSQRDLGEALKARGFVAKRSSSARGWQGISPIGVPDQQSRGEAA